MPDLLIDAGANAGYASLYFALMYPIKKALLIEANSELYSDIAPIIAEMNTLGVKVYLAKGALVGKTREVKIEIPENSRDSKISDTSAGNASGTKVLTIPGKRLSEWLADAGFAIDSKNALLKMDIEGAEYELIKDDPTLFKQFRYLIAEVHGVAQKRDTFAEAIKPSHKVLERQTTPACDEVEVLVAQASV